MQTRLIVAACLFVLPALVKAMTLLFKLAGETITVARLTSVLLGVVGVHLVGRSMSGHVLGLCAAELLAVSGWSVHSSRFAIMDIGVPTLVGLGLAAAVRAALPIANKGYRVLVPSDSNMPDVVLRLVGGCPYPWCDRGHPSMTMLDSRGLAVVVPTTDPALAPRFTTWIGGPALYRSRRRSTWILGTA